MDLKYDSLKNDYNILKCEKESAEEDLNQYKEDYASLRTKYDNVKYKYDKLKKKTKPKTVTSKSSSNSNNSPSGSNSSSSSSSNDDDSSSSTSYTVYITDYGQKYHAAGCRYLKKSSISISKSDAIQRGYTACSHCHP